MAEDKNQEEMPSGRGKPAKTDSLPPEDPKRLRQRIADLPKQPRWVNI
jgi:hypothetical protein